MSYITYLGERYDKTINLFETCLNIFLASSLTSCFVICFFFLVGVFDSPGKKAHFNKLKLQYCSQTVSVCVWGYNSMMTFMYVRIMDRFFLLSFPLFSLSLSLIFSVAQRRHIFFFSSGGVTSALSTVHRCITEIP